MATTSTKTKAEKLLGSIKTASEKASIYYPRIKRSLLIKLTTFKESIDRLEDEINDLENFSLDTNLNKGMVSMTMEACEERFSKIFDKKFELDLLTKEYESRKKSFEDYFGNSDITL